MRLSLLAASDWLLFILAPLIGFGTAVGYTAAPYSHAPTTLGLWAFVGLWTGISLVLLMERSNVSRIRRYFSQHQMWVGWTRESYKVDLNDFDTQVATVLLKMSETYPDAWRALAGCTIVFREPEWIQLETLRRVRGEQDGMLLVVGWTGALVHSALAHELGHRVLEVCASIPGEEEGHRELVKYGLE